MIRIRQHPKQFFSTHVFKAGALSQMLVFVSKRVGNLFEVRQFDHHRVQLLGKCAIVGVQRPRYHTRLAHCKKKNSPGHSEKTSKKRQNRLFQESQHPKRHQSLQNSITTKTRLWNSFSMSDKNLQHPGKEMT